MIVFLYGFNLFLGHNKLNYINTLKIIYYYYYQWKEYVYQKVLAKLGHK